MKLIIAYMDGAIEAACAFDNHDEAEAFADKAREADKTGDLQVLSVAPDDPEEALLHLASN